MKKIAHILLAAMLLLEVGGAYAQKQNKNNEGKQTPAYKTIPASSFFTINAEYLGGYRPDQYFSAQTPAFGFKAGTMRNVGWYVGVMTNFRFKGAFVTCEESDVVTGNTNSSYFDALAGITLRYWKPFSFHLGLGYTYRTFNNETLYGQWAHTPSHTAQGPATTAGFMLHLGGFVVSAEVLGSYNLQGLRDNSYQVDKTRFSVGLKAGLGLCIPYNYRNENKDRAHQMFQKPVASVVPERRVETAPNHNVPPATSPEPTGTAVGPPKDNDAFPTVVTLPVSQLSQGWVTVSGEVVDEGSDIVTERGVCWGTSLYPTVTGAHTSNGEGVGYFTTVVSGLQPGKTYYIRSYAGTRSGVRYGNTVSVTLPDIPQTQPITPQPPVPSFQQPVVPQQPMPPTMPQQMMPQQPIPPTNPQQPTPPTNPQPEQPQQP